MILRRTLAVSFVLLAPACGIDVVAAGSIPEGGAADAGRDAVAVLPDSAVGGRDGSIVEMVDGAKVAPSHVGGAIVDRMAPDLTGVVAIDTTSRVVRTEAGPVPGVRFEDLGGIAVLFVGAWTVDVDLKITGDARLVVVAARAVTVSARLEASALRERPGPGGAKPRAGRGAGADALPMAADDPGGGGAGFGIAGANSGNGTNAPGANGGVLYGVTVDDFFGGSGGGAGSPYGVAPCTVTDGIGGAGGGALQITSAAAITVDASGEISAAGGGGRGGCLNGSTNTMSGGGGGSGGTLFLEAPAIRILGTLAANGGGGGARLSDEGRGGDGDDGTRSLTPARGGTGANDDRNGGAGGARGVPPTTPGGTYNNAGGGGGAYGRIWLRTRGPQANVGGASVITPAPAFDTGL